MIQEYVAKGGFMFAMCSATDSLDIAGWERVDYIDPRIDGTPIEVAHQNKFKYNQSFAFKDFKTITDPLIYEFWDIDVSRYGNIPFPDRKF